MPMCRVEAAGDATTWDYNAENPGEVWIRAEETERCHSWSCHLRVIWRA